MKTSTQLKKFNIYLFILLLFIPAEWAFSQWSSDPSENTIITIASNDQREAYIISDGAGGAIIAWRDYRNNSSIFGGDIFAQRLNAEGVIQWTENGTGVNRVSSNLGFFKPIMVEDGFGGGIIAWGSNPLNFYNYDLFAQKVNSEGERSWNSSDITISNASGTESFHKITSDGSDGAIITWTHLPGTPGTTDIYAQRVDPEGTTKWTTNGVQICMAEDIQSYPELTGNGNGGAIITWSDSRTGTGTSDIYAQLIDAEGVVQWQTDGVAICDDSHFEYFPVIISNGNGGAIITWEDNRSGSTDIYAQMVNANGEPQWTTNGIPICTASGNQLTPDISSDGEGGAIIVWQDERGSNMDIYGQRVNSEGENQWTTNGVVISDASGNQSIPEAIEDGKGGIIVTWTDYRSDDKGDIYVQRLNASGLFQWEENGTAICTASGTQIYSVLVSDGDEGAILAWEDLRSETKYDIYAQRIDKNGNLGMIKDEDKDGISDEEEQGPDGTQNNYDGNLDGTPDNQQANVASFLTHDKEQYVTLIVPEPAILENVQAINHPDPNATGAPEEGSYPYGFFSFTITGLTAGSQTTATFLLHNGPTISKYYKYSPTPTQALHWFEFDYDSETGAVISNDSVILHLMDGERGDYDITANGIIVEPGGPIQSATSIFHQDEFNMELEPVYPNPFNQETNIAFTIPSATEVTIEVFDLTGKLVTQLFNKQIPAGRHKIVWPTPDIPEGIYLLKMTTKLKASSRKIVKVK